MDDHISIDGVIYDADGNEVDSSYDAVLQKNYSGDVSLNENNSNCHITLSNDDGRSWEIDISTEQLSGLVDSINTISDMSASIEELGANLSLLVDLSDNSLKELQEVIDAPSDYYQYISDVFGQVVFFVSLIFGLLVFMIFSSSFRK